MQVQNDVVQYGVYFSLAVSALSLPAAFLFTRLGIGRDTGHAPLQQIVGAIKHGAEVLRKRQSKTLALVLGLLLPIVAPTFAHAQSDHAGGGGEANLVLPDLSTVNFFGMNGHALLIDRKSVV